MKIAGILFIVLAMFLAASWGFVACAAIFPKDSKAQYYIYNMIGVFWTDLIQDFGKIIAVALAYGAVISAVLGLNILL